MRKIFVISMLLVGVVMLSGFMGIGESEVELEGKAIKLAKEVQRGDYKVISTQELHDALGKNDILVIDTMPYEASYKKNHIPGAKQILFPIPDMETWDTKETAGKTQADFEALLGADKDRMLVFYCGFVKCTRSHNGAAWARKLGYTNVYRHPGGIKAWKEAGYPVDEIK
ncbi:rhodanese-like domain-containing protein [Halodesulfovibrio sp.]|uniref:rhodanese-like domain-containing protein n=1 Tax=Halodesulfovibrio sp. TaxID=1912772 RepID=UPI0025FC88A7|nr:rhodanese-like domain-containing protein [Halodesulfovibrio sp.]MCT4626198.1 rhodanese-like domain-containing protein [Halodesulfovibrio sp.]